MDPLVSVLMIRAAERVVILFAGLFLVYLGYRLFIDGVSGKSSLKAKRGDGGIELLNAAPGLFFCLFGFLLLGIMSFKEVRLDFADLDGSSTSEALSILLADATNKPSELATTGVIPDERQGDTSEIVMEDALQQVFTAAREGVKAYNFGQRLRVQQAYETVYYELGVNEASIHPGQFLADIGEN